MTVNYFLECPICNSVTQVRTPASYIKSIPVRIHCGKCNTLMTGEFVSNEELGACYFIPQNCKELNHSEIYDCDFYGEISGELVIHKVCLKERNSIDIMPFLSPAMLFLNQIELEKAENYIDYVCYIDEIKSNWDNHAILYNLFLDKKYDLIKDKYKEEFKAWDCCFADIFGVEKFVHLNYLYDFGQIFGKKDFINIMTNINYEIVHLNKSDLKNYISKVLDDGKIAFIQEKMFNIMKAYIQISLFLMPALSTFFHREGIILDRKSYGLSTCTFDDVKHFYLDAYEALATCCDVIKCMDNIKYRGNYNNFGNNYDVNKFCAALNGNKIKELNHDEFFSNIFSLDSSSKDLRNAIGHGNYKYDGIDQLITYTPNSYDPQTIKSSYLIDVATDCIKLMRSSVILEFIIFELVREKRRVSNNALRIHPILFARTSGGSLCPCGSGKKYSKCCKAWVKDNKKKVNSFNLPPKSSMRYTPGMSI